MIGMSVNAAAAVAAPLGLGSAGSSSPAAMRFSRSMRALKPSRAIASMPKVANSLRRMS